MIRKNLAQTVAPKIVSRALNYITRIICSGFVIPIRKSVGLFFTKRRFNVLLGINTGVLGCIVKLPDEVCVSHTKRVGENKAVLQL